MVTRCGKCRSDTKYGKELRETNGQCKFCKAYYNQGDASSSYTAPTYVDAD